MNNEQASPYAQRPWLRHYDYWVPAEINIPEQSIYQTLATANVHYVHHLATAFLGGHLTFAEIKQQADKLATSLLNLGVKAGDYRFMLTAIDGQQPGGGQDKFRIRIWNNAGGGLVYDNQMNAPDSNDPTTLLGGGSH